MLEADLTSDTAVELALHKFRDTFGSRIASVIHLVAYFYGSSGSRVGELKA